MYQAIAYEADMTPYRSHFVQNYISKQAKGLLTFPMAANIISIKMNVVLYAERKFTIAERKFIILKCEEKDGVWVSKHVD